MIYSANGNECSLKEIYKKIDDNTSLGKYYRPNLKKQEKVEVCTRKFMREINSNIFKLNSKKFKLNLLSSLKKFRQFANIILSIRNNLFPSFTLIRLYLMCRGFVVYVPFIFLQK